MNATESLHTQGKWAAVFTPRRGGERRYWLVKSEPEAFSFDDLLEAPGRTTSWDGVRNPAARNFLRDGMKRGDQVFFYHSGGTAPAVVGVAEVVREGYPDTTAFDGRHAQYDAKSSPNAPQWYAVDLRAVEALPRPVTLAEIKKEPALARMPLVRIGRLSVSPVSEREWTTLRAMASRAAR
ncbi:MAG: EVE domain-containing protein [Gemmatimonadaceae bacterium]